MARKALLVVVFLLLFSSVCFGSGFFTPEVGTKAIARGGAFIAGCDDLSALYLNPGALSRIKGTNLYLNVNYDIMHTYYRREPYMNAVWNRNPLDVIPFLGVSSDFNLEDWTFAFGLYGPYGVTQRYPYNGPQRYAVLEANSVQIYYALGVGWTPFRWVRIGADLLMTQFSKEDYYGFSILKDRNPKYDIEAAFLAESDFIPSWSAGIILEPVPWVNLAFSYISRSQPILKGTLTATMPDFYSALLGYDVYEDKISVFLDYPDQFRGGIRYIYRDIFDIEAAFSYIPWSSVSKFPVDLEKEELLEDFDLELLWEDSWSYRLGGSYRINDHWQLHAGYFWENPATPDRTLGPGGIEGDRNNFSGGVTLSYFGFDFTVAYAHIFMDDRETDAPDVPGTMDDGHGRFKSSFDYIAGAFNINFEKMYYTFKGYNPASDTGNKIEVK